MLFLKDRCSQTTSDVYLYVDQFTHCLLTFCEKEQYFYLYEISIEL